MRAEFSLAASLERAGRFAEASEKFSRLLERDPDNSSALNYLGYMYADSGVQLREAEDLIDRALVIDPDNGAFIDSYGWELYRLGRFAEADEQLRRARVQIGSDAIIQ